MGFSGLYASPIPNNRPILWQHLSYLRTTITEPWIQIGDFNEITLPGEQKGGAFHHHRAAAMLAMIEACDMIDIPWTGGKFTWHHKCRGNTYVAKRLDRGLADMSWQWVFPDAYVEVLNRVHSDHNPLLLRCGGVPQPRGPCPFQFEAAWIDHDDYQGLVEDASNRGEGSPIQGHKQVQEASITFNREVFDNIFKRKRILENRLRGVQRSLESVDSVRLLLLEQQLQQEYDQVLFQEEIHWFQKSKEKWVLLGDRNTRYFHAQTMIRRKRNRIHGLHLPCGEWCTDELILQEEAQKFFKDLFCSDSAASNVPFVSAAGATLSA